MGNSSAKNFRNLHYISEDNYQILIEKLTGIQKQLTGLIMSIRQ